MKSQTHPRVEELITNYALLRSLQPFLLLRKWNYSNPITISTSIYTTPFLLSTNLGCLEKVEVENVSRSYGRLVRHTVETFTHLDTMGEGLAIFGDE